jgi:hypothetical protein
MPIPQAFISTNDCKAFAQVFASGGMFRLKDGRGIPRPDPMRLLTAISLGETDDCSHKPVTDPVHIKEINATIMYCLGVDHERFSFRYQGLGQRLTGVDWMNWNVGFGMEWRWNARSLMACTSSLQEPTATSDCG